LAGYFFEHDEGIKQQKKETALKNADYHLDRLEKAVKENGGFLVKGQVFLNALFLL
jgi:hypothetical protein